MSEEIKNGVISEESLNCVAGGLKIDKDTLKKSLKAAGIVVLSAGTLGIGGKILYDKGLKEGKKPFATISQFHGDVLEKAPYDDDEPTA